MLSFIKSFSSNIHYKYAVQPSPQFSTGGWSVYDAKNKTTNDPVSVLVLSKKAVAKTMNRNGTELRTAMWEEIKGVASDGVHQLTKIRHPGVVKVVEPIEAGKGTLTFVTERLVAPVQELKEPDLDEISVVRGITTIAQALEFLHTSIGVVHLNLTPETVVVDALGDWKLLGFEFAAKFEDFSPGSFHLPQRDPRLPHFVHPPYNFLAPELVIEKTCGPPNDVWGLACLLYYIYLRKPPLTTHYNPNAYADEYAKLRSRLSSLVPKFPAKLRPYIDSLFSNQPDGRMTLDILRTTDFLQNPLIKALHNLDEYQAKPVEDKVSFLKHLVTLVPSFPKTIRLRKLVTFAINDLSNQREPTTGVLVGNVLFTAAVDMSALSFSDQILPIFAKLTDYRPFQESVATNIEVVVRATSDKDFSKHVLPLLVDSLKHHDAQYATLQTQILKSAAIYCRNLTVPKTEQLLFPAVIDCFAATPTKAVKVAATEALSVLVEHGVSKTLIMDRLVPALQAMKTRDTAVVVAVADLWRTLCPRINAEEVFTLALPHLLDCALAKQFTVDQFKHVMSVVQEQIDTVMKQQVKTLMHNQPEDSDDWLNPASTNATPAVSSEAAAASSGVDRAKTDYTPSRTVPHQPSSLLDATPVVRPLVSEAKKQAPLPIPPPSKPSVPTLQPTRQPALQPTRQPTLQPTRQPTLQPTRQPINNILQPTSTPTTNPLKPVSIGAAPVATPAYMAPLVPTNKNMPSTLMPVIKPTAKPSQPTPVADTDDFGEFTSSKQLDSLI